MSLGSDVAAALVELRAHAESLMADSCVITGPGASPEWDEANGRWTPGEGGTLYEGKCRVTMMDRAMQGSSSEAGEASYAVSRPRVDLPVDSPGAFPAGAVVTFTAISPMSDPALLASVFKVTQETSKKSFATARRLACVEVTDG